MAKTYATPGVYIEEKSAFPNSAVPVATAVPAFIGYTEKAILNKKDITNVPTRISSFGEYQLYFGGGPTSTYALEKDPNPTNIFTLKPKDEHFLLFRCMKMFFANGGSDCYIVSIGDYKSTISLDHFDSALVAKEGEEGKLIGISTLLQEPEPTMLVIPDAVLLWQADCYALQQKMLLHCGVDMRNRVAILDIYDGFKKRTLDDSDVVTSFKAGIGSNHLQWGTAYYPWVHTTVTDAETLDFTNIDKASHEVLITILTDDVKAAVEGKTLDIKIGATMIDAFNQIAKIISAAVSDPKKKENDIKTHHQTLLVISPLYKSIMTSILEQINLLPPSAGMAGVYAMVDNSVGVFQAPANVSMGSVIHPAVNLTNDEQEDLNMPLNGKAVNAIRTFPGKGVLVWGARTLDGNSQDWRYVNVRRTVIFIEQSIKNAAEMYVFEPNTATTWSNMKAMLTNLLINIWQQGALAGATPEDAFSINIGLGETMTDVDMLNGILRITVKIAVTRPAEFIVITFEQQMQQS
jgi:uncharacterized protein